MFVIASTGRAGTLALATALDAFSDHRVAHEPEPTHLQEAWLKYHGEQYRTESLCERLKYFAQLGNAPYGETFRAPNLLDDIAAVAPAARFAVLVREPMAYLRSAFSRGVMLKSGPWDRWRLLPADAVGRSRVDQIALHWLTVNEELIRFSQRNANSLVLPAHDLQRLVEPLCGHLGVRIHNRRALAELLATRPNSGGDYPGPTDEELARLDEHVAVRLHEVWATVTQPSPST